MTESQLSHYDDQGRARMVDVGAKTPTSRRARASGRIHLSAETFTLIESGQLPKGHPFEIARYAGISAAKRTPDLIPLCHPLKLTFIDVEIIPQPSESWVEAVATVAAEDRTGAEMEALTACTIALLTIYDMLKAVDQSMLIGEIRLQEKTGGRSDFHPVQ
jgi:cyclic pyranopterin phosphate synthase